MDRSSARSSSSSLNGRSKRSTTDLSNLRLAPLSVRYIESSPAKESSSRHTSTVNYTRNHSSYLQGKSAPTSPGILSRSSSRKQLHGLSRRSSLYDNGQQEVINYEYAGNVQDNASGSIQLSTGRMPKAKSEAALSAQRNTALRNRSQLGGERSLRTKRTARTGGTDTPRTRARAVGRADDWVARTGAIANAILRESRGQSWMSSRPSSTSFTHLQDTTDEEDDERYEEMAALSTSTSRLQPADDELTPINTRTAGWGSKYGSRAGSRRTSRRGSFTGNSRPALAPLTAMGGDREEMGPALSLVEADFVDPENESDSQDDEAAAEGRMSGLSGIVDRLMNFDLFKVQEREEATDEEAGRISGVEAAQRRTTERHRKREEKAGLLNRTKSNSEPSSGQGGTWSDAAWLLGVASKVIL